MLPFHISHTRVIVCENMMYTCIWTCLFVYYYYYYSSIIIQYYYYDYDYSSGRLPRFAVVFPGVMRRCKIAEIWLYVCLYVCVCVLHIHGHQHHELTSSDMFIIMRANMLRTHPCCHTVMQISDPCMQNDSNLDGWMCTGTGFRSMCDEAQWECTATVFRTMHIHTQTHTYTNIHKLQTLTHMHSSFRTTHAHTHTHTHTYTSSRP